MGNKRGLILILSGLSIALITLLFSLPMLIENLIIVRLSQLGYTNTDLVIDNAGFTTTQIRLKNLTYNTRDHQFSLQAGKIQLDYTFDQLLSGRVDHIHLSAVKLLIQKHLYSRSNEAADTLALPILSNELPFQRLTLDHMRIENATSPGRVSLINLQGNLITDTSDAQGLFNISSGKSAPIQLNIKLDKTQNHVLITDPESKSPVLSLNASPPVKKDEKQQTNITLNADLSALQILLSSWGVTPHSERISGTFTARGQLAWPLGKLVAGNLELADISLNLITQLDLDIPSGLAYADNLSLSQPLTIKLQHRVMQWQLGNTARVSFYPRLAELKGKNEIQALLAAQGKQVVYISAPVGLAGQFKLDADFIRQPVIKFDDALHITYGDNKTALASQLVLSQTTINLLAPIKFKSHVAYSAALSQKKWPHAKSGRWAGEGQIELSENDLDFTLSPDSHMSIKKLEYGALTIPSITARLASTGKCRMHTNDSSWKCTDINLNLEIPESSINDKRIQTGSNKLQIKELAKTSAGWLFSAQTDFSAMTVKAYKHTIKLDTIHAAVYADHQQGRLKIKISAVDGLALASLEAVHRLDSRTGQADYSIQPVVFTPVTHILTQLLDREDFPLELNVGQITANGRLSWQPRPDRQNLFQLSQSAQIRLQDIGGSYLDTGFSGMTTTLVLHGVAPVLTEKPAHIQLSELNPGLAISNISFDLNIAGGSDGLAVISANQFTANLLGGQISSDRINYDPSKKENHFKVDVDQINIEELLMLYQDKNLYGTGIVDGILPLIITDKGLKMTNGKLSVRPPGGILRYIANETVKGMAKTNQNMGLLIDAMKDFHYSVLETKMEYSPDGTMNMFLQLEGYNPELKGGKRVHLNINLEENILDLMRSLRLADDIGKEIGKQLQKQ